MKATDSNRVGHALEPVEDAPSFPISAAPAALPGLQPAGTGLEGLSAGHRSPAVRRDRGIRAHEFMLFDAGVLAVKALLYFAALAAPAQALWLLRERSALLLLGAGLVSFPVAASVFLLLLILARKVVLPAGKVPRGRMFRKDPKARRWLLAAMFHGMLWHSPFWHLVNGNSYFRQLYYRGMGARIDGTFLTAGAVKICDPWSFRAGREVFLGEGATVSGHKIEHDVVSLGPVEIGDRVLIGSCSIIFPDVKIGSGAVVGAHSVVTRGTVIPPGETWAGNPAVKVDPFRRNRS